MITFEQLSQVITDQKIPFDGELSLNTCINDDLLLVGDDAEEFLKELCARFNVKLSGLVFSDYFPDEATSDMHYYLLTMKNKKSPNSLMSLVRSAELIFWGMFSKKPSYQSLPLKKLLAMVNQDK